MKIFHTERFSHKLKKLPLSTQRLFKKQESIFAMNWQDPRLHSKKMVGDETTFSFRVTRRYRVLFVFTGQDSVLFVSIGHRKDVYD